MSKSSARKLQDSHKAFLVTRLAMYDSPREAADALKEEYGIEITPQGAEGYDPTKRAGRHLAAKWRELFDKARADFLNNVEKYVPEANRTVRVAQLAASARALRARGNHVAAADMLERIAKELGNVHTNRRELTGRDGGPVAVSYSDMTEDQLDARIAALLAAAGGDDDGDGA